jgi:hypothetical protein
MFVEVTYYLLGREHKVLLNPPMICEVLVEPRVVWMADGNSYTLTEEGFRTLMSALS